MTIRTMHIPAPTFQEALLYQQAVKIGLYIIALLFIMYIYAVGSTVHFVLNHSSYEKKSRELTSEIATIEVNYLKMSESLTLARGETYGLHEAQHVSFVERSVSALSQNTSSVAHEL